MPEARRIVRAAVSIRRGSAARVASIVRRPDSRPTRAAPSRGRHRDCARSAAKARADRATPCAVGTAVGRGTFGPMLNPRILVAALAVLGLTVATVDDADARRRPRKAKKFQANKTFGIGLLLGNPTALSGKYFYSGNKAFDFGIGAVRYYRGRDGLHLHADHLWHPVSLASTESFELPLYLGIGFRLFDFDDRHDGVDYDDALALGVRAPLGIAFDFNEVPIDVFVEVAFVVDFVRNYRDTYGVDLNGGVGFRYWF
jgi:hypothetical protein